MKLRESIKNIYYRNKLASIFILPFLNIYNFYRLRIIPEKRFLEKKYKKTFGKNLNWNKPKTFNEKIQWLKINDRTSLHTKCADKFLVRNYIKEKIGEKYLVPLVFQTEQPKEIEPSKLPDYPIIIKANHNSGGYHIVFNKNEENWDKIRKDCKKWLKKNFYYQVKEWQYKNINPRIIIEKLLLDKKGNIPYDYKIHCFNGIPEIIQVDLDRQKDHRRNWYDKNFKKLPFEQSPIINGKQKYPSDDTVKLDPPENFELMKELATKLSEEFCYVRVDFYNFDWNLYFSEITFHHESGFAVFSPSEWDKKLGEMINFEKLNNRCNDKK